VCLHYKKQSVNLAWYEKHKYSVWTQHTACSIYSYHRILGSLLLCLVKGREAGLASDYDAKVPLPHEVWEGRGVGEDSLETFMPISHSTRRHIQEDLTLKLINSQSRNNYHPTSCVMSFLPKSESSRPFLTASCTQNRGWQDWVSPSESSMYQHYQTDPKGIHPTPSLPPMQEHSQNLKEDAEGNNLATFIGESRPRHGRTRLPRPQGTEWDWTPCEYLNMWKHTCSRRNAFLKAMPLTLKDV
jgi:hypothetical protein